MVGFNADVLRAIDRLPWPTQVVVIEEPHLWNGLRYADTAADVRCFEAVLLGQYQQSNDYQRLLRHTQDLDAVLPGREYAVEAAARIAHRLSLPGIGITAAESMRDKLVLRERARQAGIVGPCYREVMGPADVVDFVREHGPSVLKPSNRHANLGVVKVAEGTDIDGAWALATSADEGDHLADRPMSWRYMVETELHGPEYSTEALVSDGAIIFANVTRKHVNAGPYPLETGHDVPGIDATATARFERALQELVHATSLQTGVVHAEWIDTTEGLALIESAARLPSGRIPDLIELAYGFSLERALVELLTNKHLSATAHITRYASVSFITARSNGVAISIEGMDEVASHPKVEDVKMLLRVGQEVVLSRSSWDRVGYVTVTGSSREEARALADNLAQQVRIEIGPC